MTGSSEGSDHSFTGRLRRSKIVQWGVAYLAGAWLALQLMDLLRETWELPTLVQRMVLVVLAVGFLAALVVAWYHGERGEQRATTVEILMLAALAVLAGAGVALVGRDGAAPRALPGADEPETTLQEPPVLERSLVVVPFENVGADPENEYFSDGLTEELINALSRVRDLHVAPRTSSFAFKGQPVPVDSIARRLKVAHVLDGSVRRDGGRLRITASLVRVQDGFQVWSERFDRELRDIFAVQEEISQAIVRALEIRLGADAIRTASQAPTDLEAYDLYLRGRFLWKGGRDADIVQAIELFQQALERDPGYAAAWVGLADAYTLQANWGYEPPREVLPQAKQAVLRGLELAPDMAEARTTLAHLLRWWDHDRPAALREFEAALRLRPDYPEAHQWYAWFLVDEGRFDEAVEHMRRAHEIDPLSAVISAQVATMLLYGGRYAEAAAQARRALEADSMLPEALWVLSFAEWELGERTEALARLEQAIRRDASPWLLSTLGYLYAVSGRREEALRVLRELEERMRQGYVASGGLAQVWAGLGEKDHALVLLEEAFDEGSLWPEIGVDPGFATLRSEPRFQALLAKLGLR
jgi:TolB-like protein/Tfp pilus assembly protein PilF